MEKLEINPTVVKQRKQKKTKYSEDDFICRNIFLCQTFQFFIYIYIYIYIH